MLHLGGRIGGGVVAGTGLLHEVIQDTIARIHKGARAAGRAPEEVDILRDCMRGYGRPV